MFLGTIIIVAPIVSLIFWLGRLNDRPIGKRSLTYCILVVILQFGSLPTRSAADKFRFI